jgi:selenocysteine lyase/cysteine desulfurase
MSGVSDLRSLRESVGEGSGRLAFLRDQIVGADSTFVTPFGERLMVYGDYTASGRSLLFVENYLQSLQRIYANTHTEDDTTGRNMTQLLHEAEAVIKSEVNAGPDGCLVAVGTGATGAINKLQQILGVYYPPATRARLVEEGDAFFGVERRQAFEAYLRDHQPVVFVGPYEHHSNEISWRLGLATVVEVRLDVDGGIDLDHLEGLLQAPEHQGRVRIGSFSAASNVTGTRTPVHQIARLLHRYGAIACFDYAASAPYVAIDMNPPADGDGDASLDAVFISAHKFLGGPGSSGILVFNRRLYRSDLPPTVAAGGTVDYVSESGQDFIGDVEEREKAGTPGTLQMLKAALAFEVKRWATPERIEAREAELVRRAMRRWLEAPNVEILGNPDPDRRIAIVSFNVGIGAGVYLHPKFVTALLNDLFGIQSRAGCSCAGPYGHRLLQIAPDRSNRYREVVHEGHCGMKPGWCRLGFHYTMDDAEADYIIEAVEFVGQHGAVFLPLYHFDLHTGTWTHRHASASCPRLTMDAALGAARVEQNARPAEERRVIYRRYLDEARREAGKLAADPPFSAVRLEGKLGDLQFFALAQVPDEA